jgi:predicted MFS family arabinose efflux permease/quinol monooxygenase YgiN
MSEVPDAPQPTASPEHQAKSAFAAFRHPAFLVIWMATVVANIGSWMYSAASGWLMTSLHGDALSVALVQVASSLPIFLFAIPAGALADILDKRRFLIIGETAYTLISAAFAVLVWRGLVTPSVLLAFTFLIGAAGAVTAPAWQAIVPLLVPQRDLQTGVAANSVGVNVSRAIGPALGGAIIPGFGIAAPFWINAISDVAVILALVWWRPPLRDPGRLPPERLGGAIRAGLRNARHNSFLRSTLVRTVAFFLFASAYWALLPLVARNQVAGGSELYGLLLGTIGAGAIGGAFGLPWLKTQLGPDRLVAAGTLGTAIALVLFGLARTTPAVLAASALAGVSWIAVLSALNVSAQVALPDWVRARGLAVFVTIMFGATTLGSAVWGQLADVLGLPASHFLAAAGAVVAIPLTWRWKLQTGAGVDLMPSMHWAPPVTTRTVTEDEGPVLVTIEYRIKPGDRHAFLRALARLSRERRRDGAYRWGVFEDTAQPGRYLETFLNDSWIEHLRQHRRVTRADQAVQRHVDSFQTNGAPITTHYIAAEAIEPRGRGTSRKSG